MKTTFRVSGYIAFSELDNFDNGCNFDTSTTQFVVHSEWSISSPTLRGLLDELKSEFCADSDECLLLDSCDENGRVDLRVNQQEAFNVGTPSAKTLHEWKAGKRDLWLTSYLFNIIRVESDYSIVDALAAETAPAITTKG